jgi:hypothetical protein
MSPATPMAGLFVVNIFYRNSKRPAQHTLSYLLIATTTAMAGGHI